MSRNERNLSALRDLLSQAIEVQITNRAAFKKSLRKCLDIDCLTFSVEPGGFFKFGLEKEASLLDVREVSDPTRRSRPPDSCGLGH